MELPGIIRGGVIIIPLVSSFDLAEVHHLPRIEEVDEIRQQYLG